MKNFYFILSFIFIGLAQGQVLNNSFETWSTKTKTVFIPGPGGGNQTSIFDDPNNWSSSNLYPATNRFGNVSIVTKETGMIYHLAASVKLKTTSFIVGGGPGGSIKVPGILISGGNVTVPASPQFGGNLNINSIPGAGFPISYSPARFTGAYSLINAGIDTVSCFAQLKKAGAVVATATFFTRTATPINTYSKFDVPFVYTSCQAPDTIVFIFATAPTNRLYNQGSITAGTTLWVDSIGLTTPIGFIPTVPINARGDFDTMICVNNKQFNVLKNDDTCGSNGVTMTISAQSPIGVATVVNNMVDFTLNLGAPSGFTQIRYKICNNNGRCDSANLNIYVANTLDAINDFDTLRCDTTKIINVRANDIICVPNNDTITVIQQPFGGVALVINNELHFVQAPGAPYGNTTIRYALCDKAFTFCDTATIFFTSAIPVDVVNHSDSLLCDTFKNINLKAFATICPKAQDTFMVIQQSNKGLSSFMGGVLTFVKGPTATFGNTLIQYAICDKVTAKCDTANLLLYVGGFLDAVNDFIAITCDSIVDIDVKANDYVCASIQDSLFISIQSIQGTASVVNKKIRFIRKQNAPNGNSQIRYLLCNTTKTICDSANINININNGVLNARDNFDTVACLSPKTINILSNDSKSCYGNYDSLKIFLAPKSGNAIVVGIQITYTPDFTTSGVQRFVYRVCDTTIKQCDTASVYVFVSPLPAHSASNDSATVTGASLVIKVLNNDISLSCALSKKVSIKTSPLNGTTSVIGDSTILYTPKPVFVGADVFDYYLCNQLSAGTICDSAKVYVTVMSNSSIQKIDKNVSLLIWPNPATENINIQSSETINSISIFNSLGEMVYKNIADSKAYLIDIRNYPTGVYLIQANTLDRIVSQHVILNFK